MEYGAVEMASGALSADGQQDGATGQLQVVPQIVVDAVRELEDMARSNQVLDASSWTVESAEMDKETGLVTVTTTEFRLVDGGGSVGGLVQQQVEPQDGEGTMQAVTLRRRPKMSEEETKEFLQAMEKQRREIISVQRRSTPADLLDDYQAQTSSMLGNPTPGPMETITVTSSYNGHGSRLEISTFDDGTDGGSREEEGQHSGNSSDVDRKSIIESKEDIKKFLMDRMQQSGQVVDEDLAPQQMKRTTTTLKVSLTAVPGQQHVPQAPAVDDGTYVSEVARPCFIEKETPHGAGKIAAFVTHNFIAKEIEECRQREEELKIQRHEVKTLVLGQPSPTTPTVVFGRSFQDHPLSPRDGHPGGDGVHREEAPLALRVDPQADGRSVGSSSLSPRSLPDDTWHKARSMALHDSDPGQGRVKVRPLVDDSDDDEGPFYRVSTESAVEMDIRLAREREEALHREKETARAKLLMGKEKGKPDKSPEVEPNSLGRPLTPLLIHTEPVFSDVGLDDRSTEVLLIASRAESLASPVSSGSTTSIPAPEHRAVSSPVALSPAVSTPDIAPPTTDARGRMKQRHLASARLQQEVNEVIQKELELREAGTIVTTSQDRTDDKVISLRHYRDPKPAAEPRHTVPMSAPAFPASTGDAAKMTLPPNHFFPTKQTSVVDHAAVKSVGVGSSRTLPRAQRNGPVHTGTLTKGAMAKFIASRGKFSPVPVFVPKTPKESMDNGIPTPPKTPDAATLEKTKSTEKVPYRRSLSTVESKILEELRDMKLREEELRKVRLSSASSSLEALDEHSSLEASEHAAVSQNGLNGSAFSTQLSRDTRMEITNGH